MPTRRYREFQLLLKEKRMNEYPPNAVSRAADGSYRIKPRMEYGTLDAGQVHGIAKAGAVEGLLVDYTDTPSVIKVGLSGCKRCCGESYVRDIGLIGGPKGWTLAFGGNSGRNVRCADELAVDVSPDRVLDIIRKLLDYYTLHGRDKERTARFTERIGVAPLKDMIEQTSD